MSTSPTFDSPTRTSAVIAAPMGVLALAAAGWSALKAGQVPEPMAVHFNLDGAADGFAAAWPVWAAMTVLSFGLLAVYVLTRGGVNRWISATTGFSVGLVAAGQTILFTLNSQLVDAADARLGTANLTVCLAVALALGAWGLAARPARPQVAAPRKVEPVDVPDGGAAAWAGIASYPSWFRLVLAVAGLVLVVLTLATASWAAFGALVLLLAAVVFAGGWRLTADSRGLTYRGVLGWPTGRVPAETIVRAEVVELSPGRWGGWGYRTQPGATALVTRGGTALQLHLQGSRLFAVTCTDPEGAAAVLNRYRSTAPAR